MDMSRAAEVAMAALPFAFIVGLSLMRFAQGADRPRAVVDGYLGWVIVSYGSAELLGAFGHIGFLPVFAVWGAADAWLLYRLWCLRARAAAFWRFKISTDLLIVAAIGAVTLFVALTTAPNDWDSQTYHLPRVEHWIQDRSLAFYSTSNWRQNEFGPVAEVLLLQTRILGGSDMFYPLVQWISMVCAVAAVFRITRQLGGDEPLCWLAAVFLMTLPIGILESTSTETDYVVTALLACGVTLGSKRWRSRGRRSAAAGRTRAGAVATPHR
jgi:4-amino-4-deoxy-L-arabinose transferase-like glycosyltransferase